MVECSICLTNNIIPLNKCITQCNHNYCKNCLDSWFNKGKDTCPMCRQPLQYFAHNGAHTRVISVERPRVIEPPNPRNVIVSRRLYQNMLYTAIILAGTNIFTIYLIKYKFSRV